ncbi:phosphopantothenoylcysteine decarboxylase domain-containing protein [Escherichia coli]
MVKNPDIVAGVAALKDHRPYVVGFAAETNNVEDTPGKNVSVKP